MGKTHANDTTILDVALEFSGTSGDGGDTTWRVSGRHFFDDCWRVKEKRERVRVVEKRRRGGC